MSASTVNDEPGEGVYMSDTDSSSKRKGSPLQRDIPLKRQASFDDIYNTNLKGATQQNKKVDKKLKGKPASFSVNYPIGLFKEKLCHIYRFTDIFVTKMHCYEDFFF